MSVYRRATRSLSAATEPLLLVVRVLLGVLFIDHGLQKYSGKGGLTSFEFFLRTLDHVPFPGLASQVVPAIEVGGGVLLLIGLVSRLLALVLAAEMLVTGVVVKLQDLHTGLVTPQGAGAEVDFALLLLLVVVIVLGPGRASVDTALGLEGGVAEAVPLPARVAA